MRKFLIKLSKISKFQIFQNFVTFKTLFWPWRRHNNILHVRTFFVEKRKVNWRPGKNSKFQTKYHKTRVQSILNMAKFWKIFFKKCKNLNLTRNFTKKCKILDTNTKFHEKCKISQKAHFSCFSELQGQVYWMAAFATATPLRKFFFDSGYQRNNVAQPVFGWNFPKNS